MRRILALAICMTALGSGDVFAFDKPPFPRLGANWIANQNYQDPKIQAQLARGSIALLQIWPGWEQGKGTNFERVLRAIKAVNPHTLVFLYINNNEINKNRAAYASFAPVYQKLDTMKWYLYRAGDCCEPVDSSWQGAVILNNTAFSPQDSKGENWVDWYAHWVVQQYAAPDPDLDGFNTDNVFWKPQVDGDWNRDGTLDKASDPTTQMWLRQGYVRHFTLLKQLMPGKYQIGNVATWGQGNASLAEYQGLLNGGVMEGMIGYDWSVEAWGGWQAMMAWYRKTMSLLAEPKLGIFHQVGNGTDYQSMRYGLTSTLMDEGYYIYNTKEANGGDAPWFDEYQAALGNEVSAPPNAAWQNGVYRRDFEHGIALVNPKGNGARTVTLEADFRRLSGRQAPQVNNGQVVRTLTLQDRDGIILMKIQPRPAGAPAENTR